MIAILLILILLFPLPALSSTFVLDDNSQSVMFDTSDVIAFAEVVEIRSFEVGEGQIETEIDLHVIDAYKGTFSGATVVVTQPGGKVGSKVQWIPGSPTYTAGEKVYVFLRQTADGKLTTSNMTIGRVPPILEAPSLLGGGGKDPVKDLKRGLLEKLKKEKPLPSSGAPMGLLEPERLHGDSEEHLTFRFMQPPSKWQNLPVSVVGDNVGDSKLGKILSQEAVVDGTSAWSDISNLTFEYANPSTPQGFTCVPGKLLISFNDPRNQIQDPVGCSSGALAVGGFCADNGKITAGAVVFGDKWDECWFWNQSAIDEIMTHEIGHSIGLAHSWEGDMGSPSDPRITDATMFWTAHFDGRGASLKEYDIGASRAHYGSNQATPAPTHSPTPTQSPTPTPTASPTPSPTKYSGRIDVWFPYSSNEFKGVVIDVHPYPENAWFQIRNPENNKKVAKRGPSMPLRITGQQYQELKAERLKFRLKQDSEWQAVNCKVLGIKHTTHMECVIQ